MDPFIGADGPWQSSQAESVLSGGWLLKTGSNELHGTWNSDVDYLLVAVLFLDVKSIEHGEAG